MSEPTGALIDHRKHLLSRANSASMRRASATDLLQFAEAEELWTPLILADHHQRERQTKNPTGLPLWREVDPPSSNPRKHTASTARRPSVLSLGMKQVRGISKSVRSMAEGELKFEAIRFAHTTTAHGNSIRFLRLPSSFKVLQKYQRKDKIVNVELQFESANFPAVTICNQNPFKHHLSRTVPQIAETLDAYHQAVTYSKDANSRLDALLRQRRSTHSGGFRYVQIEPVQSDCQCKKSRRTGKIECAQKDTVPASNDSMCICNFDRQDSTAWPCFPANSWTENICPECNDIGKFSNCLKSSLKFRLLQCKSTLQVHFLYLHVDPSFGNCYTFNANLEKNLTSSRAGPSYGLRLLVHINHTDYLPTTQATGVRIAIHHKKETPFPDTFGYSAPTGAVSSFGMSMRKVKRLSYPYGDCVRSDEELPRSYIYRNSKYEPEACYRSCCADPRYPTARNDTKLCDSLEAFSRTCLMRESIGFTRSSLCLCRHPCENEIWTTTYSSARLIADAFGTQCDGRNGNCAEKFDPDSLVMLEVYYEQMSYEALSEREAYSFVNFLSDVGGQAGLWLGASVITLFEFFYFVVRITTAFCRRRRTHDREFNFDRSARNYSATDTMDDPLDPRHKQSMNEIRFTLTPAQSAENLNSTSDVGEDDNVDRMDSTSFKERLNKLRDPDSSTAYVSDIHVAKKLVKIGLPVTFDCPKERQLQANLLRRPTRDEKVADVWGVWENRCMICLLLTLILALAIVATVVLFLVSGKCPGGVQSAPLSAYEKAMVKYATLQELKALKRLAADEKEAEAYELVHSINTANSTWTARFNKAAVGMDVQKQLSDKMNENSKISTGIYYTLSDIFNVVRINGKYVKHLEKLYEIIMDGIPNRFDARDKWPECEIGRVYDQGDGQNFRFSAQKLIECCPYCGGCNGSESHKLAQNCGYPCKLETYFKPKGVKNCSQTCVNGRMERRKHADYVYRIGTVNGTRAYTHLKDIDKLHVYDHCVKTIGWEGGHLIAVNSWSKNWAKDGRIERTKLKRSSL
ncbi:Na+ channel, amiloride-sensitive family and Degenerin family-containing protein [Aphelenchoides besseyi]|nr:Na+ channel, amiloride-sensitive family and Degenerin family-containing protein [Aphelenchoides besseyi]